MDFFKAAPMRFLLLVTGTWLVIFFLTRTVLLLTHLGKAGSGFLSVFAASTSNSVPWATTACLSMAGAVTSTT